MISKTDLERKEDILTLNAGKVWRFKLLLLKRPLVIAVTSHPRKPADKLVRHP